MSFEWGSAGELQILVRAGQQGYCTKMRNAKINTTGVVFMCSLYFYLELCLIMKVLISSIEPVMTDELMMSCNYVKIYWQQT